MLINALERMRRLFDQISRVLDLLLVLESEPVKAGVDLEMQLERMIAFAVKKCFQIFHIGNRERQLELCRFIEPVDRDRLQA